MVVGLGDRHIEPRGNSRAGPDIRLQREDTTGEMHTERTCAVLRLQVGAPHGRAGPRRGVLEPQLVRFQLAPFAVGAV